MGRPSVPAPIAAARDRWSSGIHLDSTAERPALPELVATKRSQAARRVEVDGVTAPEWRKPRR